MNATSTRREPGKEFLEQANQTFTLDSCNLINAEQALYSCHPRSLIIQGTHRGLERRLNCEEIMGRIEIEEGKITIAYGQDRMTGYFLSVSDERLWDSGDASDEVNDIALEVTKGAGYFDLHTAPVPGFGHRVKLETLLEFWKRYGVPDAHIQKARRGENIDNAGGMSSEPLGSQV